MNRSEEKNAAYIFIAVALIGIIATLVYYFNLIPIYSTQKLIIDSMNYSSSLPLHIYGFSRISSKFLPLPTNSAIPYLPVNAFVDTYKNNTEGSLLEVTTYIFGNNTASNYSYNTFKSIMPTMMPLDSKTINTLPSNFQGMSSLPNTSNTPDIYTIYAIKQIRGCLLSYSSNNSIPLQFLINMTNICLNATNVQFNKN